MIGVNRWILICGLVAAAGCEDSTTEKKQTPATTPMVASKPTPEPPAPEPPAPTPLEQILAIETYTDALAFAKPHMSDTTNETSPGVALFTMWAQEHLRWTDVFVEKDETSIKLTMKDPDAARGKRLCYSGSVSQISKASESGQKPLWQGQLMTRRYDVIKFFAAGSSGTLVDGSRARLCGVVTGTYSYSNVGGGTTHAIMVVGMFKLPENIEAK